MAVPAWLKYANMRAVRDDPLSPELLQMLETFMPELGLGMEVFSGGQEASGPDRVGSHRHDYGNSGDVFFTRNGRRLSYDNPEDLPLIQQAVTRGRQAGITGWGAGAGYMQPGSIHLGLGEPAVWGAKGKGENAPDWLKQAYYDGTLDAKMQNAGYTPQQRRDAIASIESAGSGDYAATGAWTGDPGDGRDRAYGRYQVMGSNIAPWAEQYLKKSGVTPEMFLADPALQDQMFDAVYGDYVGKYGERGAASKWFTGSEKEPLRTDVNGKLTGQSYADKYMAALGGGQSPRGPVEAAGGGAGSDPGVSNPAGQSMTAAQKGMDAVKKAQKQFDWDKFGEAFGDIGGGGAGMGQTPMQAQPQAALAPTASGGIDPEEGERKKAELARLMANLNNNRLW